MRDDVDSGARTLAGCRRMCRHTDGLRAILILLKRNGFGVGDVRRGNKDFLLGEGAWSVRPSPWPVLRQEFSIPENARRQCKDRPWFPFVGIRYLSFRPLGAKLVLMSQSLRCRRRSTRIAEWAAPEHGVPETLKIAHEERLVDATGNKRYVPHFIPASTRP